MLRHLKQYSTYYTYNVLTWTFPHIISSIVVRTVIVVCMCFCRFCLCGFLIYLRSLYEPTTTLKPNEVNRKTFFWFIYNHFIWNPLWRVWNTKTFTPNGSWNFDYKRKANRTEMAMAKVHLIYVIKLQWLVIKNPQYIKSGTIR